MNWSTKRFSIWVGIFALLGSLPVSVQAVPAFARQIGVACNTCHFQHFPMLNSFGRAFKGTGFSMSGTPNIESEHFSLPSTLNMALFTNIRYQKSNGSKAAGKVTSNNGELSIPAETSLFIGGRVNEYMGALVEGDFGGGGAASGAGFLASLKLPLTYQLNDEWRLGLVPFTSGLGPAYAFETLNTGAVGNQVMNLVHPTAMSASQYIQVGAGTTYNDYGGDAEGIGGYAESTLGFVTLARWSPNHITLYSDNPAAEEANSAYVRAALTPMLFGWDTGFGLQVISGEASVVDAGTATPVRTKAYMLDAQIQGLLGDVPLGVYFGYGIAPKTAANDLPNLYNPNPDRKWAASLAIEAGVINNGRGTVQFAYRRADNGQTNWSRDDTLTLALTYIYTDNVQMSLIHTVFKGGAHDSENPSPLPLAGGASGAGNQLTSLNLAIGY